MELRILKEKMARDVHQTGESIAYVITSLNNFRKVVGNAMLGQGLLHFVERMDGLAHLPDPKEVNNFYAREPLHRKILKYFADTDCS